LIQQKESVHSLLVTKGWISTSCIYEGPGMCGHSASFLCSSWQAAALSEARQYPLAEALYIRAKRPEAALQMYRAAGQLQAALRLAEAYLPTKAKDLHLELAANMGSSLVAGGSGDLEGLVSQARAFEKGNDYARAIEIYLSAHAEDSSNLAALEQCWMQVGE
jgi:intraflagellar transport protein 172